MKEALVILMLISNISILHSQINIDSLRTDLKLRYKVERKNSGYGGSVFENYINDDSLRRFSIITDSDGNFGEKNWHGVYMTEHKYDEEHRVITIINYDSNGKLFVLGRKGQQPGKIEYVYNDEGWLIKTVDYFGENKIFPGTMSSIEYDYDIEGNLIERKYYDDYKEEEMIFRGKTKFIYQNEGKTVIRTSYNKKGKLNIRKRVAKHVIEYDTAKRLNRKKIGYLNKNNKLVNKKFDFPKKKYAIVTYTYYPEDNTVIRLMYNAREKYVGQEKGYYIYRTEGRENLY